MAQQIDVVPGELRGMARIHRDLAERLGAQPSAHDAAMTALESWGPVFADVREAARDLLEQRRVCYQRQSATNEDLAATLCHVADAWELNDAEAAHRLGTVIQ